jgi:hypothetical protein
MRVVRTVARGGGLASTVASAPPQSWLGFGVGDVSPPVVEEVRRGGAGGPVAGGGVTGWL